jgi:hypothetical protein
MSALFTPYTLKDVTLRNRIAFANVPVQRPRWPHQRLAPRALCWDCARRRRVGHRGSHRCLAGRPHYAGMHRAVERRPGGRDVPHPRRDQGRRFGAGHPDRSCRAQSQRQQAWAGDDHIPADDLRGWQTISSSAIAFGGNLPKAWTLFPPASVPPVAQCSGIKRY